MGSVDAVVDDIRIKSGEARISEDLTLHYQESGKGLPVVFIPGWTMTTEVFSKNIRALSDKYRFIAYDPRSQGRSTVTDTGNNYYQHGRDLHDFLNYLELDYVILAGWSLGGVTAYSYLEQFGCDRVRSLISIDICPRPARLNEAGWGMGTREEVRNIQASITSPDQSAFIRHYAGHGFLQGKADDEFIEFIYSQSMQTPATTAALLLADGNLCDYSEIARQVDQKLPVLHIVSENTVGDAKKWTLANMPNALVHGLGAHMMFWEYPVEFNALVDTFLIGICGNTNSTTTRSG